MFDWIPLIGEWSPWQQLLALTLPLLFVTAAAVWISAVRERRGQNNDFPEAVSLLAAMGVGVFGFLALVSGLYALSAPTPVPPSSVSERVTRGLDSTSVEIGSGCFESGCRGSAELALYGERSAGSFTPVAYRMRTSPGDIGQSASWILALPEIEGWKIRNNEVAVSSPEPIRADGRWQGGLLSVRGSFATGQTLEIRISLPDGDRVTVPVAF